MPPRAVATTEHRDAPILLSLYTDSGLVGRVELSPVAALHLAFDLIKQVVNKAV
jgi:hypothetical protein